MREAKVMGIGNNTKGSTGSAKGLRYQWGDQSRDTAIKGV